MLHDSSSDAPILARRRERGQNKPRCTICFSTTSSTTTWKNESPCATLHLDSAQEGPRAGRAGARRRFRRPRGRRGARLQRRRPFRRRAVRPRRPLCGERPRLELAGAGVERGRRGGRPMIARSWTAEATPARAREYILHFRQKVLPGHCEHRGTPRGLRSDAKPGRRCRNRHHHPLGVHGRPSGSSPATTPTSQSSRSRRGPSSRGSTSK